MGHLQGTWHPWVLPPSHLALLPSVAACLSGPALFPSVLSLALQAQPLVPEQACALQRVLCALGFPPGPPHQ